MKITAVKTHKITTKDKNLHTIFDQYLPTLKEKSILAVTSKIVSISQGRVVSLTHADKDTLIEEESQFYLPRNENKYNVSLTITQNTLVASAGIDESNSDGNYILWPQDPQRAANDIRAYLQKKFHLKEIGVVITDSKTTPLRWGVTAIAIAFSGVEPLKNYVGSPDLFGRPFVYEKMSIIDNLASAAALEMGEGNEQTPLAVIEDAKAVEFVAANPSVEELGSLHIKPDEDLYAPLLQSVRWKKGKK